jgi:hypothetical protein
MALAYSTALRTTRMDAITTAIGSSGLLRIYDGSRPASGGAATTLLAELALTATAAPGAASGVLTFSAISNDASSNATGTATWFRVVTSGGTFVIDGSIGTSGSDLNVTTTSVVTGSPFQVTSFVITEGNP